MLNLVKVKKPADMQLDGITFDCEFRDKTLAAVTLTDASGRLVRFVLENYSVNAYVPAVAEKKKVHVVSGNVRVVGTPIRETFDEAFDAEQRRYELECASVVDGLAVGVEEVEVLF